MVKADMPHDVAAAVKRLADALLEPHGAADPATVLEHLRLDLHASDAFLWLCDDARASCALHAGGSDVSNSLVIAFDEGTEIAARLGASGSVFCRAGEVSGLESFVPSDFRSYAATAAAGRDGATAVLAVAWPDVNPKWEESDAGHLRIAAALLSQALSSAPAPDTKARLSEAIAASVASRIAVVDRSGVIVAVNAAWTDFATRHGAVPPSLDIGVNYLDVCRHAAAVGEAEARAVTEGIEAVFRGSSETFSTTYTCDVPGEERWWIVTVTPLRHVAGGAVIEHLALTHPTVDDLAQRLGNREFERLAEAAPVPVWIATGDGRLLYSNEQWPSESLASGAARTRMWTEPIHPEDCERASAVFRLAASRRRPFHAELRVRSTDGSYRWWSCRAAPRYAASGELECYVGVCSDAMMTRTWKSAFDHVAGKLVAAQESERIRIARELHDDLGQQTAVLASKIDMLSQKGMENSRLAIDEIRTRVREIAGTIHNLSHQLHPAKLRLLGLVRTLAALCRDESLGSGVAVRFAAADVPGQLPEDISLCLFRVAQEGVRNALKHSGCTTINVMLSATPSRTVLEVSDNGSGFNPLEQSAGLGLLTMRERVQLVRGVLSVQPLQPHGTTVRIVVPLNRDADSKAPHMPSGVAVPHPASASAPSGTTGIRTPRS